MPVGLPLVVMFGLLLPSVGQRVGAATLGPLEFTDACIVAIFLVNGMQVRLAGANDRALLRALAVVLVINLLVAPLLGGAAVWLLDLPLGLAVGIALMASVPTTLSSAAVIAVNVGGDRLWALTLTIVTVLLGSITAPLAVSAILSTDVSVSPWPILQQVLLLVLVPSAVGYAVRKLLWAHPWRWLDAVPSLAVLAVVWVTMSSNADTVRELAWPLLLGMVVAAGVGHGSLLGLAGAASRGMPVAQAMPVLFVASQKTLPVALTILTIISHEVPAVAEVAAVATITCVVWHFLQLFADSLLSHRLALRHAEAAGAAW